MLTRIIVILALSVCTTCHAQNFVGDPELVAAAEEARVRSAVFWTGRELRDWDKPCPISWTRGEHSSDSGSSTHNYNRGEAKSVIEISGPREKAMENALPHEVDHVVRHSIIGKPIPRWLDEGCAAQFESAASRKMYRSALLHGNLRTSVWDMFGVKEYPRDSDSMTALYSGSASLVEWMLEMSSPKDLMRAQEAGMDSHQKWKMYVGEDVSISRQRYEKWFAAKYAAGNPEPALPSKNYIDVWIAGDFDCPPCKSFLAYARSTTKSRGFDYHIHRISLKECQERGMFVPMFVAGDIPFEGTPRTWQEVDEWARSVLKTKQKTPPPPTEDIPLPVREPQLELPPIPQSRPVEVTPGVSVTPEGIRAIGEMLDPRTEPKSEPVINWEGLTVIIAASNDFPALAMAGEGPGRRAVERLTNGKAKIIIISERAKPSLFESYESALGLDVKKFHVSILVPEMILTEEVEAAVNKIEVIFNNNVSNYAEEKVGDIPVEIISERISPADYIAVNDIFSVEDAKDEGFRLKIDSEIIKNILYGAAATVAGYGGFLFYKRKRKPVEPVS